MYSLAVLSVIIKDIWVLGKEICIRGGKIYGWSPFFVAFERGLHSLYTIKTLKNS